MKNFYALTLAGLLSIVLIAHSIVTPDLASMSERWTLNDGMYDVSTCAWIGYNVGPLVVSDGSDCGHGWEVGLE